MSRRPLLLTVLATAAIGLAACGTTEPPEVASTTTPSEVETTSDAAPADDETSAPAGEPTEDATEADTPTDTPTEAAPADAPADDEEPAAAPADDPAVSPVTLAFDGREVPVATQCTGVDGAILATTEGEVTITLVREAGLALRYQAEGTTAETDAVEVTGGTDTTTYRATLSSDEVAPLDVTMVVMDDAMAALSPC
jgi:hypothetical protein